VTIHVNPWLILPLLLRETGTVVIIVQFHTLPAVPFHSVGDPAQS